MIVKNISGETRYFTFAPRGHTGPNYIRGRSLANNATVSLPDNDLDVLAKVQSFVAAGVMSIVQGPTNANLVSSVNLPASGYISCATGGTSTSDVLTIVGAAYKFAPDPGSGVLGTFYASLSAIWAGAASATPATAMGTLKTAINANSATSGIAADTAVLVGTTAYLPLKATLGNTVATGLTLVKTTGANLAVSGATLTTGVSGGARNTCIIDYAATSGDVSAGLIVFPTALANIGKYIIQVQSSGAIKAWDGVTQITGTTIVIDNSGSTDWAAADVISIIAFEAQ